MRTRIGWLIIIALLPLTFISCNGGIDLDDSDDTGWSDTFLKNFYIGSVPVISGETVNVPFSSTYSLRFELTRPVTNASLTQLLDFEFWITNMNTGQTALITDCNLDENGTLVWVGDSDSVLEYRMSHSLGILYAGGQAYTLGAPGHTFKVHLQFLIGQAADGTQFALMEDEFFVVWISG